MNHLNFKTLKQKQKNLENLNNKYNIGQIPIEEYVSNICNYLYLFCFLKF
jgi:hypothetical protein